MESQIPPCPSCLCGFLCPWGQRGAAGAFIQEREGPWPRAGPLRAVASPDALPLTSRGHSISFLLPYRTAGCCSPSCGVFLSIFSSSLHRLPRNICKMGSSEATKSVTASTALGATSSSTSSASTPPGTVRSTPWTTSTSSPSTAWWCRRVTGPARGLLLRKSSPPPSRMVGPLGGAAAPGFPSSGVYSGWDAGSPQPGPYPPSGFAVMRQLACGWVGSPWGSLPLLTPALH